MIHRQAAGHDVGIGLPVSQNFIACVEDHVKGMKVVALLRWSGDSFVRSGASGFHAVKIMLQRLDVNGMKEVVGSNGVEGVNNPGVSGRDVARGPMRAPVRPLGKRVCCPPASADAARS